MKLSRVIQDTKVGLVILSQLARGKHDGEEERAWDNLGTWEMHGIRHFKT